MPRISHGYRARLVAAEAHTELGQPAAAKELLLQNLEREGLTPRSSEWRESLRMLGRIFYDEGVTQETQARLHGLDSADLEQRKAGLKDLELAFAAYQEAIRRLAEAVAREEAAGGDSWNPETTEARY